MDPALPGQAQRWDEWYNDRVYNASFLPHGVCLCQTMQ